MSRHYVHYTMTGAVLVAWLLVFGLSSGVSAQVPGLEQPPSEGVLVLRNGHLFEGVITRVGDRFNVAFDGGEISVKISEVELCCRDLEEAYRQKKARMLLGDAHEHVQLAQWCQRNGLLEFAREELAQAIAQDPTHPMIPLVDRRLQVSLDPPDVADLPAKPAEPSKNRLSAEDLDRMIRGMPPGTVETFTRTIQPLLNNTCRTAQCHGPGGESGFSLLRLPSGRPPSRQTTRRNLHATNQWIDRDKPAASPLLTSPMRPHGSAEAAVFSDHKLHQYGKIVEWVYRVAQAPQPAPSSVAAKQSSPFSLGEVQPAIHFSPVMPDPGAEPFADLASFFSGRPGPDVTFDAEVGLLGFVEEATETGPTVKRGGLAPGFVPVDPFDPEIFNRRFFGQNHRKMRGSGP